MPIFGSKDNARDALRVKKASHAVKLALQALARLWNDPAGGSLKRLLRKAKALFRQRQRARPFARHGKNGIAGRRQIGGKARSPKLVVGAVKASFSSRHSRAAGLGRAHTLCYWQ